MTEPSVTIQNLVKRFGDFAAVDDISLETSKGEIFGFLGPNGAGKSTTIRMLCGLLRLTSGRATVAGFDVTTQAEAVRRNIGYMSQKFSLYNDLTVIENLHLFAGLYNVRSNVLQERIDWALTTSNLHDQAQTIAADLPGGWKQRLALGCAVLHRPPILFLDEPTSGVDPIARRRFWDLIHQMSGEGVTVFVSTHYMEEAEYCNRIALIYRGKIVALGTPTELKQKYMKGQLLEIECAPLSSAIEVLQPGGELVDVAIFGSGLHVVVEDARTAAQDIRARLERNRISVQKIEHVRPSLEDVFVSLTGSGSNPPGPEVHQ